MWPFSTKSTQTLGYRKVDDNFAIAAQIAPEDMPAIAEAGFKTVVCARPDDEEPGQPDFAQIAEAARKVGLKAVHIPVAGMLREGQLIRMENALKELPAPMFGYCRSGARAGSLYTTVQRLKR
jgi:uncharacterized protein (TIGR01244 family)